jgi:hypothetical protein
MEVRNQDLAAAMDIPYSKIRRWAKEILLPDTNAKQRSGHSRQYSVVDAYTVTLYGHLVSDLLFSTPEARQIVGDIKEWLIAKELYIDLYLEPRLDLNYEIQITQSLESGEICYVAVKRIEKKLLDGETNTFLETYTEEEINGSPMRCDPLTIRILRASDLLRKFYDRLPRILDAASGRYSKYRKKRKRSFRR